jgi:hypothetical protein
MLAVVHDTTVSGELMLIEGWPTPVSVVDAEAQPASSSVAQVKRTTLRPTPRVWVMYRLMRRIFSTRLQVFQCY